MITKSVDEDQTHIAMKNLSVSIDP